MEEKRFPVTHSDEEWRKLLTPEQYDILRGHGTEAPGTCALNYEKRAGTFSCAGCGQELFASKKKFESGTGWPSFNDPIEGSWKPQSTAATAWFARKSIARPAAVILGTSSTTVRRRHIFATASTE